MGGLRSDHTSIYMELTAQGCRAAKTVHKPVPVQSPGWLVSERPKPYLDRLAQSRWGSVLASGSIPTDPVLRANLFPKLQIRLADFPYLHCSIDQRLFNLEAACCGYGYDLRREWTLPPGFSRAGQCNTECFSRRSALRGRGAYLRSSRFQANPPLTKKRQLFPGLRPASPGSIASQLWPSRGGELRLQVREYWPDSLSTRGRTPARGRLTPPLRAELPWALWIDRLMCNGCSHGTLLHDSALKALTWVFATTIKHVLVCGKDSL